jgi:adenine C2-methylase RlmN of 23S rRNA A2503 and tRNA A37
MCAQTGTMGIIGDLTAGEIIEQVMHANSVTKIRNVVFMGMGEPLNNWQNVKSSVEFLIDTRILALSPRHVTVSTVGVVHNMKKLTLELPAVNLAVSLHAPNQEVRLQIVPAAKAHKFEKLIAAIDFHIANCKSKSKKLFLRDTTVMIEYILIQGVNDQPVHAHELGQLLTSRKKNILLNLIPYNPTDVTEHFEPPTQEDINTFFRIITADKYGIYCRVRQEMGQDIDGACGQLALKTQAEKKQELRDEGLDIEEIISTNSEKHQITGKGRVKKIIKENKSKNNSEELAVTDPRSLRDILIANKPFVGGSFIVLSTICLMMYRRLSFRK